VDFHASPALADLLQIGYLLADPIIVKEMTFDLVNVSLIGLVQFQLKLNNSTL
jgi:hypothetical protein